MKLINANSKAGGGGGFRLNLVDITPPPFLDPRMIIIVIQFQYIKHRSYLANKFGFLGNG